MAARISTTASQGGEKETSKGKDTESEYDADGFAGTAVENELCGRHEFRLLRGEIEHGLGHVVWLAYVLDQVRSIGFFF